jgi:tetratricopeptide (TPR) repeat protein/tRNA A-37 threonylcarbamoyl transferase component Bud32
MQPTACPAEDTLRALVTGRLSGAHLEAVAAHLDSCLDCQGAAQQLDAGPDPIRAALRRGRAVPASDSDSDRNLLFAVLALQSDLIDQERFVQVCTLWASRKNTPLAALLVEQGWLSLVDRADVERLLARKLKRHKGNVRASLAEAAGPPARAALAGVADPDVERSVAGLTAADARNNPSSTPLLRFGEVPGGRHSSPADRAGRNLLFEEIGHGGMGIVLRGRDPDLGRDLAVKFLRPEHHGDAGLERRFVEEAQIAGQMQHPGIVPVYELGRFPDQRPYFTMKLIKGSNLAELLNVGPVCNRPETTTAGCKPAPQDLPHFLGIFEHVCQALAYAHSMGVIHRDLKPSNIMVGAFGEVQVMDWGLAKVLTRSQLQDSEETTAGTMIRTARSDSTAEAEGRTGVVGTPAYMAPEQARGEIEAVDERADVFGLGSILCVILSGKPPFVAPNREEVIRKASAGDLTEAFARLDGCGAEAELTALARSCLAPCRDDRPRNAGEVTARLSAYLAGVQERLRQAGLDRAAAEARAEESAKKAAAERRTRQVAMGLASALVLLVVAGGGVGRMMQQRVELQRQTDREVAGILERAKPVLQDGWRMNDLAKLNEAKAEADRALALARNSASAEARQQCAAFSALAEERLLRAEKNDLLRVALLNVSAPRETSRYQDDGSGRSMAMAEPSVEEQYAEAFRRWGVDVLGTPEEAMVKRLREEPEVVVQELIAALDAWTLHRQRQAKPKADWRRLYRLAEQLDRNERSRKLRSLLVEGAPPQAEIVAGLVGVGPPLLVLWRLNRGDEWRQLQQLSRRMNPAKEPVLTVVLLAQALFQVGDSAGAEAELRQALAARPYEVVLLDTLGKLLERQGSARLGESIACYQAIRARESRLGVSLGRALWKAGRAAEGEWVLRDLVHQQKMNPEMYSYLGVVLSDQRKMGEAVTVFRQAIALWPDYADAYYNLGNALHDRNNLDEAAAAYRQAIVLKADDAKTHNNLGITLVAQKKLNEASEAFRKAIAFKPDLAEAYVNIGYVLNVQKKPAEAEAAFRKAILLKPDYAGAYNNLGNALSLQTKVAEAVKTFRKAIALKPEYGDAYYNLGNALYAQNKLDEAVTAFRKAIELKPDYAGTYYNLGFTLSEQNKRNEAMTAYRQAIALKPDYAQAHCNLGGILQSKGMFTESLASFRRGHELGSREAGWPHPSAQWVRRARRLVELDEKLPALLRGDATPKNAAERIELANVCSLKRWHASAARFCADAFAEDGSLMAYRYKAACSAALAGCGQGEDRPRPDDNQRTRLRRQALDWLRADLVNWSKRLDRGKPQDRAVVLETVNQWKTDADLAGVRDKDALAKLPEDECKQWQKLWTDVDALLRRGVPKR